jgi:hypothetical protein
MATATERSFLPQLADWVRTPPACAAPTEAGNADYISAPVKVKHTGAHAADEIAQLYLHYDVSSVEVHDRQLRGLLRIHLKPGKSGQCSSF